MAQDIFYCIAITCFFIMAILFIPFIYPLICNLLIRFHMIKDVEQIKQYIEIFKPFCWIMLVSILIFLKHYFGISFREIIEGMLSNVDLSFKRGDNEVKVHGVFKNKKIGMNKISDEVKEEVKEQIFNEKSKNGIQKCNECELKNVVEERESLRYFSAYQITNKFSRELLKKIMENDRIEQSIFIDNIEQYYKKTIKNMGRRRKEEFIETKIAELLFNLRYLDIIEYTEDDEYIILTQNGIEFVKGYAKGVG